MFDEISRTGFGRQISVFYENIKRTPSIKYTSWRLLFTEQKLLPRVETRVWTQRLTALVLITWTDKSVERTTTKHDDR